MSRSVLDDGPRLDAETAAVVEDVRSSRPYLLSLSTLKAFGRRMASVAILATSMNFFGLPSRLPLARAFRRPARTLSQISERSSSATAPKMVKIILPAGVDVSSCSLSETNSMPRWFSVSSTSRKCRTLAQVYELKIRIHWVRYATAVRLPRIYR